MLEHYNDNLHRDDFADGTYWGRKALVGFNEEFFSGLFTGYHFHYGYLAHAGVLLEMAEPDHQLTNIG